MSYPPPVRPLLTFSRLLDVLKELTLDLSPYWLSHGLACFSSWGGRKLRRIASFSLPAQFHQYSFKMTSILEVSQETQCDNDDTHAEVGYSMHSRNWSAD